MPIYTQKCLKCGQTFDDYRLMKDYEKNPRCGFLVIDKKCGGETFRQIASLTGQAHVWKPQWFEHIAPDPIFIESKEQLIKECKKRNVASVGYM